MIVSLLTSFPPSRVQGRSYQSRYTLRIRCGRQVLRGQRRPIGHSGTCMGIFCLVDNAEAVRMRAGLDNLR